MRVGRIVVGVAVALMVCATPAMATPINDAWAADGGGAELNLYNIYNAWYGTSYTSSGQIPQLASDELFNLNNIQSEVTFLWRQAANTQNFGWYQVNGSGRLEFHRVFSAPPVNPMDTFSLVGPGETITGDFGFYDNTRRDGGMLAFSEASRNRDGLDHMIAVATPDANTFLLLFEDLPDGNGNADWDYNDLIVQVRGVVVPEPASMTLIPSMMATFAA